MDVSLASTIVKMFGLMDYMPVRASSLYTGGSHRSSFLDMRWTRRNCQNIPNTPHGPAAFRMITPSSANGIHIYDIGGVPLGDALNPCIKSSFGPMRFVC